MSRRRFHELEKDESVYAEGMEDVKVIEVGFILAEVVTNSGQGFYIVSDDVKRAKEMIGREDIKKYNVVLGGNVRINEPGTSSQCGL